MNTEIGKRLPAVKSLSCSLPAGTEGGKEFARVIGLLLFQEAKKTGLDFSLFDDAAGDFEGLDGYSRAKRSKEAVGYQYKFFPSPLSDAHRAEIKKSLKHALECTEKLQLKKWIIVTPDDFKNSAKRRGGGDVSWFEGLRTDNPGIEIEHYGHSKILSLFLQTHYLCLYYYPSLVDSGHQHQKSIQAWRVQYDENMRRKYGRIEFVGMSVYKEEASRRIPLEDIYIPLSVVPERSVEEVEDTPRINPYMFLKPGSKNIILGDPGSGKSTLMCFLALAGINKALQARCEAFEDNRLAVVVTLRRYADELKHRRNLPILDYILEVAQADFNMSGLQNTFFSYYIESGQAILLFDGLDELPSKEFKSLIRQRIDSFAESFPLNTVIVTSRLVGYEAESRFDDSYGHYRVAKLKVSEIESFINDWYAARIDDAVEKNRNAADLVKIIKHPDSDSIRELARNPLLLTIVALVHRIDAVLPDQRVVLYQKCTETLLNTWYKAKRQDEEAAKGRIERRNRIRVEAIAYWMHRRSLKGKGRSVAPRAELIEFLTRHISEHESLRPQDELAEDQAEIFVDFIKNSAGLLIEAGDGLYSFIHLTFQEYLCATHLAAFGETGGTASIWKELRGDLQNPRWREVVRLLVASLRSTQAQTYFVERLLEDGDAKLSRDNSLLLLGLLRDAIEPAENHVDDIITNCFETLLSLTDRSDVGAVIQSFLHWLLKEDANEDVCAVTWQKLYSVVPIADRTKMLLINAALVSPAPWEEILNYPSADNSIESDVARFLNGKDGSPKTSVLAERLHALSVYSAFNSPITNVEAAVLMTCSVALDKVSSASRMFLKELALVGSGCGGGPHRDNGLNMVSIASSLVGDIPAEFELALSNYLEDENFKLRSNVNLAHCIDAFIDASSEKQINASRVSSFQNGKIRDRARSLHVPEKLLRKNNQGESSKNIKLIHSEYAFKRKEDPKLFWSLLRASDIFGRNFIRSFEGCSGIKIDGLWDQALHSGLASRIPKSIERFFSSKSRMHFQSKALDADADEESLYFAAWVVLFDLWAWSGAGYKKDSDSSIGKFIADLKASSVFDFPPIKLSILIHSLVTNPSKSSQEALLEYWRDSSDVGMMLSQAGWLDRKVPGAIRKARADHQRNESRHSKTDQLQE
ncbi:NACHT domain-containing protein [Pseudomonas sp. MPDS]|uniref:NACHT domain-containing protein n=1 Tax=Pseudomonas sp. MPDS TaxID=2762896 RepID=UPI00156467C1|nr:NACHT domain-containing protein [Pseudomonas sp. MPDS]QKJ37652.1 NACHT domain-containing protein [Pseudomonas sp. MPDS]